MSNDYKELIFNRNIGNKTVELESTKPINCSKRNIRKVESQLRKRNYKVSCTETSVYGMCGFWIIGNYEHNGNIHGVFVDISNEEPDRGIVYITAAKERIESLKEGLEKSFPGIKFKPKKRV